jgi:hypothetical protein
MEAPSRLLPACRCCYGRIIKEFGLHYRLVVFIITPTTKSYALVPLFSLKSNEQIKPDQSNYSRDPSI